MPPKLTLPVRDNGSLPLMLSIFPGMARHMVLHSTPFAARQQRLVPVQSRHRSAAHADANTVENLPPATVALRTLSNNGSENSRRKAPRGSGQHVWQQQR